MSKLACLECDSPISAENMELSLMIAKCPSCDSVFSFADEVGHSEGEVLARATAGVPAATAPDPSRPLTPRDHKVRELDGPGGSGLLLEVPWFAWHYVPLALFALMWNGFLVVWYTIAFGAVAAGESAAAVMLCFPVLHLAVGIGVGYTALAGFLNKTVVSVSGTGIAVTHGPLPWRGNVKVPASGLSQLFVQTRVVRSKNSSRTVYDLHAELGSGEQVTLCRAMADLASARYLEHRVEGWLGIEDRAVPGEHLGS